MSDNDLTEIRLRQMREYADSFKRGGEGEKQLAEIAKQLIEEVRRLRSGK
jgi:hypothetical protein